MSETPLKKRRATILVTGPQSKKAIYPDEEEMSEKQNVLQDIAIARQRLHNELAVVNTATGIEILMQIVMDEFELVRHRIRENGVRMRQFFRDYLFGNQIRALIIRIFSKSISSRNMLEYKKEAKEILNDIRFSEQSSDYKMPRYTLNDIEEVLLTDDLEDGVIQRRSQKWARLPIRQKPLMDDEEDSFCEFRKLNMPMSMTFEDDDDNLSMPSTRTQMTTEDQMAAIQNQLAMLSKQLMSLQKGGAIGGPCEKPSSRASSRRGGKMAAKKPSIDVSSTSSSSEVSEDEGKGPSVCSPSLSLNRKVSESSSSKATSTSSATITLAPMAVAPPPPPPPPPPMMNMLQKTSVNTPTKPASKLPAPKSIPAAETISSNRPYLTDIANGRSLLKKTARSPDSSPSRIIRHKKRAVSSFEAALRNRFRGFHGDTSFSEQEENGDDDDDVNATWDE